jgi:polyferredoxin
MSLVAAMQFKIFQEPLVPVAGTVDLAPFLFMIALLTLGTIGLRVRWRRQGLRRSVQVASTLAFVFGLHPCACMVRDAIRGMMLINYDNLTAFAFMMLIVPVVAFALMWGRVFCGWVCPIGFVQEMSSKLTDRMRHVADQDRMRRIRFGCAAALLLGTVSLYAFVRPASFPILQGLGAGYLIVLSILIMLSVADARWEARLRAVRYFALSFFVVGTLVGLYFHAAFCVLFVNILDSATVMLFIGVILASLVLSSAWCRFLCPEGALLGLLAPLSGWGIRLNAAACSHCNTCHSVCPVEAIDDGKVEERSCLYCCKCVDACPTSALSMAPSPRGDSLLALPVLAERV